MEKNKTFSWRIFCGAIALILLLRADGAQAMQISEVMYDPDGTDAGREWVEVWNDGPSAVDVGGMFLLEADVRHKISSTGSGASTLVPAGGRAIIADKPELFSADYPSVSPVFDSAFSLSNSGERVALVSADGDEYSYAEWSSGSAASAGKSWQRAGVSWVAAKATPGAENADREDPPAAPVAASGAASPVAISAHSGTGGVTTVRRAPELLVDAGRARVVPVGAELVVEPLIEGPGRASFTWSWGDGQTSRGRVGRHTYRFPGTYIVVLNARGTGGALATSRTVVSALAPQVAASVGGEGEDLSILIESASDQEINLGNFLLEAGGESFALPEDTIVLPGSSLRVPNSTARLPVQVGESVSLRRPDGRPVRAR